jgi:hypothetical protein
MVVEEREPGKAYWIGVQFWHTPLFLRMSLKLKSLRE